MDYFDEIAAGVRPVSPPSSRPCQSQPTMQEQQLGYALAKQVPDMSRGFTIHTNYGDITIEQGWMADRIQARVACVLDAEYRTYAEVRSA